MTRARYYFAIIREVDLEPHPTRRAWIISESALETARIRGLAYISPVELVKDLERIAASIDIVNVPSPGGLQFRAVRRPEPKPAGTRKIRLKLDPEDSDDSP